MTSRPPVWRADPTLVLTAYRVTISGTCRTDHDNVIRTRNRNPNVLPTVIRRAQRMSALAYSDHALKSDNCQRLAYSSTAFPVSKASLPFFQRGIKI